MENSDFSILMLCIVGAIILIVLFFSLRKWNKDKSNLLETANILGLKYYEGEDAGREIKRANDMEGVVTVNPPAFMTKILGSMHGSRITGIYKEFYVAVYKEVHSSNHGSHTETVIKAYLNKPLSFKLAISKEGLSAKIAKLFGGQDIETGDPDFDKKVRIKSDNPYEATKLLNNTSLKKAIINAITAYPPVEVYNTHIKFQRDGVFIKTEQVKGVLEAIIPIANFMSEKNISDNYNTDIYS